MADQCRTGPEVIVTAGGYLVGAAKAACAEVVVLDLETIQQRPAGLWRQFGYSVSLYDS